MLIYKIKGKRLSKEEIKFTEKQEKVLNYIMPLIIAIVLELYYTIATFDTDFDLVSGRYVIDAKSIMGIFSLDLSKPIELAIHSEKDVDAILQALEPYTI